MAWKNDLQWADPGAANRHSNHMLTVTLAQAELWV